MVTKEMGRMIVFKCIVIQRLPLTRGKDGCNGDCCGVDGSSAASIVTVEIVEECSI